MLRKLLLVLAILASALFLFNTSWLASPPAGEGLTLIAHRGVHQTYNRANLGRDECTATRIYPPEHDFQENTLPSMQAAFAAGAGIVEIDIHPTTDGHFAVFHDWTTDCRTDGGGVTRKQSLAELQKLDVGYGYTADGGKTFPFRGKGVGQMPSLQDVLTRFPDGKFLINFKSRDKMEADRLKALLDEHPDWEPLIWGVYGGGAPTERMTEIAPGMRGFTTGQVKTCLKTYLALGWSGYVPEDCRNTQILVPTNYAGWLWGWPNRFLQRMHENGTEVILSGPPKGSNGIDTTEDLGAIPDGFSGYIWTNRIERIGPQLSAL